MQASRETIRFIEKCYKLYEQKMYQAAYRILHDSGLAEDAVQEAFLKLMKRRIYFEDAQSDDCKRYMITVIKHSSIDIYNKKKKEQEMICFFNEDAKTTDLSNQKDMWTDADIQELIADLPPKYYAVVNDLTVKNLSVKETAAELGITDAAVRKRFERAKLMLKAIVKGSEEYGAGNKIYKSDIS